MIGVSPDEFHCYRGKTASEYDSRGDCEEAKARYAFVEFIGVLKDQVKASGKGVENNKDGCHIPSKYHNYGLRPEKENALQSRRGRDTFLNSSGAR